MNLNLEQKAFEDWHFKKYYVENADKDFIYEKFKGSSEYILHTVQYAWEVWLASRSREGYKLVPTEPSGKMLKHGSTRKLLGASVLDIFKTMVEASDD